MKDSLLVKCLLLSAALHAVSIPIFFGKPLHFYPHFSTTFRKTAPSKLEESVASIMEKEAALEEAMRNFVVISGQSAVHDAGDSTTLSDGLEPTPEHSPSYNHDLAFPAFPNASDIILPQTLSVAPFSLQDPFLEPVLGHSWALLLPPPTVRFQSPAGNPFETLALQPFNNTPTVTDSSIDFEFYPSQEPFHTATSLVPTIPSSALVGADTCLLSKQEALPDEAPIPQAMKTSPPLALRQSVVAFQHTLPALSSYGVPGFQTIQWDDTYQVDIKTFAREDGGYLFSLTFLPKFDLSQYRLKQNYYFLIDRSNSIDKNRYHSFTRAVLRAIGSLREGDHFNIVVFDSRAVQFSELNVAFNKKNQEAAELFLEKQKHGHYGAATDIYASLKKIIPTEVNDNEAHTAILISDGDSHLKVDKQRQMINSWLEANSGKVTLYTAAVGQGNNLAILDLLSTAGRGSLLYSDTHTGFPRKLAKLVISLRSPIGQEMSLSMIGGDPDAAIQLYPSSSRLPYLFSDQPFVIFGKAEKLSDFSLLLQGRNKDQILSISKNISFALAKSNSRPLLKQWATYQAHHLFEQYLKEGKIALLNEAKQLLADDPTHSRR